MTGYMVINDIHLSDRPPSVCTEAYQDDLFDLLAQCATIAADRHLDAVILAGDVFHHKLPLRTSHSSVMRLIELANTFPCPVYAVPGNHDLAHDRIASLDETQPLGVVFASGAIALLDTWATDLPHPVYGVPWLGDFTDDTVTDYLHDWRTRLKPDTPGLVVAHAPLYPPGHELPYEFYPARAWAQAMGGHGTVAYGHVHEPHGVYTVDGVTFTNPGALSRGSLHEHNLTRDLAVSIWDPTTGAVDQITLDHKPAADVFRLPERAVEATALDLDAFLAAIGRTRLHITSIEAIMEHIRSLGLGADLEHLVADLLDTAAAR